MPGADACLTKKHRAVGRFAANERGEAVAKVLGSLRGHPREFNQAVKALLNQEALKRTVAAATGQHIDIYHYWGGPNVTKWFDSRLLTGIIEAAIESGSRQTRRQLADAIERHANELRADHPEQAAVLSRARERLLAAAVPAELEIDSP